MNQIVEIFTDGACSGNPGPGGWGALLRYQGQEQELSGAEQQTTNNRMELMAVIQALETLKKPCEIIITTDSMYVKDGITKWIENWKQRNWMTAAKKPVKNQQLWQRLDKARYGHKVKWEWVKGHSGHVENDRVDHLARQAIEQILN